MLGTISKTDLAEHRLDIIDKFHSVIASTRDHATKQFVKDCRVWMMRKPGVVSEYESQNTVATVIGLCLSTKEVDPDTTSKIIDEFKTLGGFDVATRDGQLHITDVVLQRELVTKPQRLLHYSNPDTAYCKDFARMDAAAIEFLNAKFNAWVFSSTANIFRLQSIPGSHFTAINEWVCNLPVTEFKYDWTRMGPECTLSIQVRGSCNHGHTIYEYDDIIGD